MTVSEMNLDNSETSFDGPPFPLRLRIVLEQASNLEDSITLTLTLTLTLALAITLTLTLTLALTLT